MRRVSRKIPLLPPKRKKKARIKILQTLKNGHESTKKEPLRLFQHAVHQGQNDFAPHSLGEQIQQGRDNAMVRGWSSLKHSIDHSHDATFRYLSPTFGLVAKNNLPD